MNVFQYASYREILREALLERKAAHGKAYTFAKMAAVCRLRHTYLSTVLKGDGHLNADQVFDAAQFVGLSDDEYRFLSLLHEHERSVSRARRRKLEQEIDAARKQGLKTDAYVDAQPLLETDQASGTIALYANPTALLVHMFVTVRRYREDPERARKDLGLDPQAFNEAIRVCERAGLIRRAGKSLEMLRDTIHLPAGSPLYAIYRTGLRLKALEFMQTKPDSRHFSFGVLYSASEETRRKIHTRFLELVDWAQGLTQSTEPTDVYQLNFDLLRWSGD